MPNQPTYPTAGQPGPASMPYTYLIGYADSGGLIGSMPINLALPVTVEDVPFVTDHIRQLHPGAIVLAISPLAPSRT